MKIEKANRLVGKRDSCTIIIMDDMISINSIILDKSEAADYLDKLRQLFAEAGVLPNTGQEKA